MFIVLQNPVYSGNYCQKLNLQNAFDNGIFDIGVLKSLTLKNKRFKSLKIVES